MSHDEIRLKIREILRELTEDETLDITDETRADDVDLWDSLLHVKLIIAIENEFGVRFETSEIGAADNVGELVQIVETKVKASA